MERYPPNGYHFPGPHPLSRPRGPNPFQLRGTELCFDQPRPTGIGPGVPANRFIRLRSAQNYSQQAPVRYERSPGGKIMNGGPFMQQQCRFKRFEGPPASSWNNQYRPQPYYQDNQGNPWKPVQRMPFYRNITLRRVGPRLSQPLFLQDKETSSIKRKINLEPVAKQHKIPFTRETQQGLQQIKAQEIADEKIEVDSLANKAIPQENDGAQVVVNLEQEHENVGTERGDNSEMDSVALQDKIDNEVAMGSESCLQGELQLPNCSHYQSLKPFPGKSPESGKPSNDSIYSSAEGSPSKPGKSGHPGYYSIDSSAEANLSKPFAGESGNPSDDSIGSSAEASLSKPFPGESENSSDYSMCSSAEKSPSPSNSKKVEEYEPENPAIIIRNLTDIYLPNNDHSSEIERAELFKNLLMESRDADGFKEVWVGVCVSRYPSLLGRMIEVAGYGVWISEGNESNFSGVLDFSRPQNLKAVMIRASSRALETMKAEGCTKVRVNLEREYVNRNVLAWIQKYGEDPTAQSSNWDEFKYHPEILDLCAASDGMTIKWSHCAETSFKKHGLYKANALAKTATDVWMREARRRDEAVGMFLI